MLHSPLYHYMPPRLQEMLIAVRERARKAIREGSYSQRVLKEITETQWLSRSELAQLQNERTRAVVRHAFQFVPYYRELLNRNGWTLSQFESASDIAKLPLLTKKEIAANPKAFVSERPFTWRFRASTSGTSGTPLRLYQDIRAIVREHAFLHRHLEWAGFRSGERRAWLRGDLIVPVDQQLPPFARENRVANMLMLSSYHLSFDHAEWYLRALSSFDPVVIQAYPSSLGFLAAYLEARDKDYEGRSLRAIITSSESLSSDQRAVIERRFGCAVYDHYGSTERVILGGTCEKGALHIESDYGLTEWISTEEGDYELVGTGFNNRVMPLIRYRTGDRVVPSDIGSGCACGRSMPVISRIAGRMDDYVVMEEGRQIGRLDHVFKGVKFVAEAQIVQREVGAVEILVVPSISGNQMSGELQKLLKNAHERLGADARIDVRLVNQIPRTANGKLKLVVSELKKNTLTNPGLSTALP